MANNKKSLVVTIAQSMSIGITFVLVFFGSLYSFNSWLFSIIASVLSIFLVFVLINHFIEQKEKLNRKGYTVKTYFFLIGYAILIVPISFFGIHALNVEFYEKSRVIENAEKKILYIKSLEGQYDARFKNFIENNKANISRLNADARNAMSIDPNDQCGRIKAELQSPPLNLTPGAITSLLNCNVSQVISVINAGYAAPLDSAFMQAKRRIQGNYNKISDISSKIHKWNRFTISKTLQMLDKRVTEERDSLAFEIKKMTYDQENLDNVSIPVFEKAKLDEPMLLFFENQDPVIYILILIFQCLLLLPYWLTKKPRYNTNTHSKESILDTFSRSL